MADFETAARPYAKALFELASDEGELQLWQDQLSLASAIADDTEMQAMFNLPSLLASELAELFLSVVAAANKSADPNDDFRNLIALLAENGRLAALSAITSIFETLKQEAEGKIEVQVRTAQELTAMQQEKISKSLAKRLGKKISLTTEIDETLIAGAVVTAGDLVIDGSASSQIDKLTIALSK